MQASDVIAGQFRLERQIGAGGLGVVWEATQLSVGRRVAVKFLKSPTGNTIRRFEAEARALARLDHPGCVTLHEFGRTEDNVPYIVMELVAGQSMAALRGTRREIPEIVGILEQLLRVLNYTHSRGIAHRDLKPENIVIGPGGQLKVLDFGLAKITAMDTVNLTETGEVFGTPIYMSPEQLRGSRDAGRPSDVYALGVMAFELLTGIPPYPGDSMLDLAMGHIGQIPPEIERLDCPIELKQLVADMLAKEPAQRPTASQALALVNPDATQHARPLELMSGANPRLVIGLVIAIAISVLILLIVVWAKAKDGPAATPEPPVVTRATAPTPDRDTEVAVAPPTPKACASKKPGLHTLNPGLGDPWDYYVPEMGDDTPRPVVIVLPTDRVTPEKMFWESGLRKRADEQGFLMIAPQATVKRISNVVGATFDALDELDQLACINRDRVYVIGHASGGDSAVELGCRPEIAAMVTASYNPDLDTPFPRCAPPHRPVPALHLAPRKSKHAPIEGGRNVCRLAAAMAISDWEAAWRERNSCSDETPRTTKHKDGRCMSWAGCAAEFTSCHIDGGHDWPGVDSKDELTDCVGPSSQFPAAEVAVDFLLRHHRRPKGCGSDFAPKDELRYDVNLNGAKRQMWMSVPRDYDPDKQYPVVLVVAYAYRDVDQYVKSRASFLDALRDAGYIVIAPIPTVKDTPWRDEVDDEFLRNAVDVASDSLCIDRSRVFGISHSDGAKRLRKLACEVPFAGLALTGMAESDPPEKCEPIGPPPTIRIVGRDDPYVPILGGRSCDTLNKVLDADQSDQIWTQELGFGCRGYKEPWGPRAEECNTWEGCETPYVSCRVSGGRFFRHSGLENHPQAHPDCTVGDKYFDLKFEKTVLPFFEQHGRPIP